MLHAGSLKIVPVVERVAVRAEVHQFTRIGPLE